MNRMYYAYARHALVAALRMARVQPGDAVLLPHFICRDVLASLKAVQAVPVFYHVDENLQVPPSIKLPPARAVLAVNYFGFPADLEQLQRQLADQNSVIIEDNAHGWLSADEYGVALGTRTSLGITSFRKTILCPDGAFLHWKSNQHLDYSALPEPLRPRDESISFTMRLRRGASQLERTTHLPVRSMARAATRLGRRIVGRAAIVENPNEEFELPRCQSVHASSLDMMMTVDQYTEIARRRTLFEQSADLARHYNITPVFESLPDGVSPQGFAFYGINGDENGFRRQIQRRRFGETMSWPHLPQNCQIPTDSLLRTLQLVNFIQ